MWKEAVIVPIYKESGYKCLSNYSGSSLRSMVGKCYASILFTRLFHWHEESKLLPETLAKFTKVTQQQTIYFHCMLLLKKYLRKPGKLYACFVT